MDRDKAVYKHLEGTRELLAMNFLKAYASKPNFEKDVFECEGTIYCYLLRVFTMIEKVFLACLWNLDKMRRGFSVGCYQNHRKKALDWTPLSCGLLQLDGTQLNILVEVCPLVCNFWCPS